MRTLCTQGSQFSIDSKRQKLEEVSVQSVPVLLHALTGVKQVACGSRHTAVFTGMLCNVNNRPTRPLLVHVKQVACGSRHTAVFTGMLCNVNNRPTRLLPVHVKLCVLSL